MLPLDNFAPGSQRGFVHKRLLGGLIGAGKSLLGGGSPITGAIGGFLGGGSGAGGVREVPVQETRQQRMIRQQREAAARGRQFSAPAPILIADRFPALPPSVPGVHLAPLTCPPGFVKDRFGGCSERLFAGAPAAPPGAPLGIQTDEFGDVSMGRFGPALGPLVETRSFRTCPRGAVLAVDGLCYNRSSLRNTDRMWPRGRRPLLTGGEMRAISVASSAAKKLERKQKQLQSLGLMKPAAARRRPQKALPPGHHAHVAHN